MPNWAYTNVTVKGTKKSIHDVIKLGLVNSGVAESEIPADLRKAFDLFLKEGKTKTADTKGDDYATREVIGIKMENGITMQTFFPMPDSYILYDTTNKPNSAPESVLAEQEKLGAIGWYDYNLRYLGTKWNAELEGIDLNESVNPDEDWATITFKTETAWSMPDRFFSRLTEAAPVIVIAEGTEESNAYFCVVVFADGEGWSYADFSEEFSKKCDDFNNKRDELEKKLKAEGKSDEEIEKTLDDEIGEYVEDIDIFEKLDLAYEKAVELFMPDSDFENMGFEPETETETE